jgi:subtilisin family serine protease
MHRSLRCLAFPCVLFVTTPLFASESTGLERFRNGIESIDLEIDGSKLGVLFATDTNESVARAVVVGSGVVDSRGANATPFVPGHVFAVPVRSGTSVAALITAARDLDARGDVLAAGPRLVVQGTPEAYYLTDELLVRWKDEIPATTRATLAAQAGLTPSGELTYARNPGVVYTLPAGRSLDAMAISDALQASGAVEFAIPDFAVTRVLYATTNDALYANQWHLESTGQSGAVVDADVDIEGAWDVTRGSASVIVAVVDTGCELAHPDLSPNLVAGTDVLDNDSNPQAVDFLFGLFTENHGTSVAGIACGRGDNGIGISGAAQLCKIMPIRFLSEFLFAQPTIQDEADAFNFARANGAAIINN